MQLLHWQLSLSQMFGILFPQSEMFFFSNVISELYAAGGIKPRLVRTCKGPFNVLASLRCWLYNASSSLFNSRRPKRVLLAILLLSTVGLSRDLDDSLGLIARCGATGAAAVDCNRPRLSKWSYVVSKSVLWCSKKAYLSRSRDCSSALRASERVRCKHRAARVSGQLTIAPVEFTVLR